MNSDVWQAQMFSWEPGTIIAYIAGFVIAYFVFGRLTSWVLNRLRGAPLPLGVPELLFKEMLSYLRHDLNLVAKLNIGHLSREDQTEVVDAVTALALHALFYDMARRLEAEATKDEVLATLFSRYHRAFSSGDEKRSSREQIEFVEWMGKEFLDGGTKQEERVRGYLAGIIEDPRQFAVTTADRVVREHMDLVTKEAAGRID